MEEVRVALGRALDAGADEVAAAVLAAIGPRADPPLTPEVEASIAHTDRMATRLIARWLISGEQMTEAEYRRLAELGKLIGTLALPDLIKAYLAWREAMLALLDRAAAQVGAGPDLIAEVRFIATRRADGSVVRMGRQFEAERSRLQAELDAEREKLAHQALHDPLTGLPNRTLLFDRTETALRASARYGTSAALLFVDLDGFKQVNDRFGHECGDQLLVEVAARLRAAVRPSDTVARLGGDEFVVLCDRLADDVQPVVVAERILTELRRPVTLGGRDMSISASVGIACAGGSERPSELLLRADVAMYAAKQRGRDCHELAA